MEATVDALRDAADALASLAPPTDTLRVLQAAQNAIDAAQATLAAEMVESRAHEDEGIGSAKSWLRSQLRIDNRRAGQLLGAADTLRDLPRAREAAHEGRIGLEHVKHLSHALRHLRPEALEHEDVLVDVAETAEPSQLRTVVRTLREAAYPDELDEAWIDGMARQDVQLNPVPDGWHLAGFLPTEVGAKLDAVLRSLSAPHGAEDPRTSAERRVDGLDALCTNVLESGLPSDGGVRPHVTVLVDAAEITASTSDDTDDATVPAHLAGFGAIGRRLMQQILCGADLTPVLTGGKHSALDVGPTVRLANRAQRRAVHAQQGGICAAPGCAAPVVHVHHVVWHTRGGPTDLANLIGLCPRCHTMVHAEKLHIDPVTHAFRRRGGPWLRTNPSNHYLRRRAAWDRIRASARRRAGPPGTAPLTALSDTG